MKKNKNKVGSFAARYGNGEDERERGPGDDVWSTGTGSYTKEVEQKDTNNDNIAQAIDNINHPMHYTQHPSGVECIDVVEHFGFSLGNAVKYIWRAGLKGPNVIEDLKKARWYLDREVSRLEKGGTQ